MVTPETGTKGQTSVAPMRGCAPLCLLMSMSSAALRMARKAASATASGEPTKVKTVRLVAAPGSTSRRLAPSTPEISAAMASRIARSLALAEIGDALDQLLHAILSSRRGASWAGDPPRRLPVIRRGVAKSESHCSDRRCPLKRLLNTPVVSGPRLSLGWVAILAAGMVLISLVAPLSCTKKGTQARPSADGTTSLHGSAQFVLPVEKQERWLYPVMPKPEPSKKPAYLLRSYGFAKDSGELNDEAQGVTRELAQVLKEKPSVRVLVVSLCDGVGEKVNAENLGLIRAKAARNALIQAGVERERCEMATFGALQAKATAEEPLAQERDRRVEIWLLEE